MFQKPGDEEHDVGRPRQPGERPGQDLGASAPRLAGGADEPQHDDLAADPDRGRQDVEASGGRCRAAGAEHGGGYLALPVRRRASRRTRSGPSMASAEENTMPTASALIFQPSDSGTSAACFMTSLD